MKELVTQLSSDLFKTKIKIESELAKGNKTNEELSEFVKNYENQENIKLDDFDEVYINGDNNIENVNLIEEKFKNLMFSK
jgi:flavodoxin